MAANTLSGYQLQKDLAASVAESIIELLHWEDMDYYNLQFDMGVAYIRWWLPANEEFAQKAIKHELFWKWWGNQWAIRDEAWLNHKVPDNELPWDFYTAEQLRAVYARLHNPRKIVLERTPGDVITSIIFKS